jgi:hypothetical protein
VTDANALWPPLERWRCDTCGGMIDGMEAGNVEWLSERMGSRLIARGFHIVHHGSASPFNGPANCYQHQYAAGRLDLPLEDFVGINGIVQLLSFLDIGAFHEPDFRGHAIGDMREFVELFRRVQVPYYEEARKYLPLAASERALGDPNSIYAYIPETLQHVVLEYKSRPGTG